MQFAVELCIRRPGLKETDMMFVVPHRPLLMEKPDIVIGTPSRVLGHLQAHNLCVKDSLEMVVIDEADLVFSFGYETDVKALLT